MDRKLFLFNLFFSVSASAFGFCPNGLHRTGIDDLSLLHKTAIIGPIDNRKTFDDFAKANGESANRVHEKYSAMGKFFCGKGDLAVMGTANVTISNDIITTAAHTLYTEDCKPRSPNFSDCYFQVLLRPGETGPAPRYHVKGPPRVGTQCPSVENGFGDWAVMKLESPVGDVTPFKLDKNLQVAKGMLGVQTAAANNNFGDPRNPPPTLGRCEIKEIYSANGGTFFDTNCSSGGWASGGAFMVTKGDKEYIAGISTRTQLGSSYDHRPYSRNGNVTRFLAIDGQFLNEVLDMTHDKVMSQSGAVDL